MKKINLFKRLLLVLIVLMTCVPSVWSDETEYTIWGAKDVIVDNYISEWSAVSMQFKYKNGTKGDYSLDQIGSTSYYKKHFDSDHKYTGINYFESTNWSNRSGYQAWDIHPSSYAVIVIKAKGSDVAVGHFDDCKQAFPEHRVYFDASPIAGWGDKAYMRYGFDCVAHADEMTKFPGTANLFYIDMQQSYYEKYTVSNSYGNTKANTVYQPTDKCKPTGDAAITKSLNFSDTDINGGDSKTLSFIPTSKYETTEGCDWWYYTKNTNTSIPTQTVTVNSTTNGKIRVEYYNTSGTSTYWEGSGGTTITVPKTAIITVKALGNAGYDASSITVGGSGFTNGSTYTVNSDITISATFTTAYAYVQGRMHVKSGSPSGSWINTFDGEGDSDKWEESSSVIQLTHDGSKYVLHTYVTPSDLSSDFEGSLPPYFYVATSSSSGSYSGLRKYRPSEGRTITGANSKASITEMSGSHSVRINSDVTTSYVVLYFDQSDVWYELEQTLNYAAGSGTGDVPATTYHTKGSSVTAAAANTFTAPTGYHFDHWSGSDGNNYAAGASVPMNSNITLTAQWTQIMVDEIALDHTEESLYKGETLTITPTVTPDNALNKDVNWSTSAEGVATVENGVVTAVAPGTATITATAADGSGITANCEITVGYKVTYDANGESGSVPNDATYYANNASVTVLGNTGPLSKEDYTFRCWNTQADGYGTDYALGATFNITDNTTLYAKWTKNDYIGKYTFHYGTSTGGGVNDFAGTWTVETFPAEPSRTIASLKYYDLASFTIPNPAEAPHFFVGYEGWPKGQLGEASISRSAVRAWSDTYSANDGYMKVLPGSIVISDGSTKKAVGAIGTLTIRYDMGENLGIGFSPNGYVLTIRNSSEVQTRTLSFTKVAGTDEIWETDILSEGLTDVEVAGTFKVGLATASGATDCFQSEWAAASVLNANKDEFEGVADENVDNYPDLAAGVKGRFQLVRVYKGGNTLRNKQNFALRYVTMKNWTIDPVLAWSQPGKWSLGHQPTIDEDVVVYHNTTVSNNNAVAKRVRIHKDGGYHTLTISPYGGLLVAEDIKAYHKSAEDKDGEDYSATTSSDLLIETNSYGNGSLICGSASTNSEASYSFFSKSYKYNTWFVNQFVGIPFATGDAWDYYGMNIYEYDADNDTWKAPGSYTLKSFTTYNLINKNNGGASNISLDGVLNLPGNSGNKVLTCGWRGTNGSIDKEEGHEDYMFANSWTAPISIEAMSASDFSGTEGSDMVHTIYIFNAGYVDPDNSQKEIGDYAGTWSSFPLSSAKYIENAVIPATQAFLVTSKKGSAGATLTLNYGKHVYTPAQTNGSINTFPTRAPRRIIKGEDPTVLRIIVRSDSAIADNMYLLERDDFKPEFDNGWDGTKILGEAFAPQLYAIHGDNKYAVDATPELDGTEIGFKAGTNNYEYTFSFEYDDDEPLYLYDKETQDFTRISNEATYTFQTKDNAEHSRFALTRSNAPQIVTAFENVEYEAEIRAEKFIENNMLFIRRGDKVYSIDGTQVK